MPKPIKPPTPKPEMRRTVTVAGTFGSQMQREIALRTLADILAIWKGEVERRHKKNKITITET
jgi:hypothetical protein